MKICLSCDGVAATDLDRCAHCGVPLLPTAAAHFPLRRGEADTANPLVGTVIDGKYLIQGVLGRGGMGTVYRACHNVSLVPVALKLLHPRLSARPEYRRGLLAEARKAGRVVHDHCARVIDVGETDVGTVYLAMELADGEPLDAWVRGSGLPPGIAASVLLQICRALCAIHAAGLVHRDLSSRNVMVAVRDGRPSVKVLDFGIAQSLRLQPAAAADGGGERTFANPVFSAPEHLAGQDVDARADLYSFGVLAFLLFTGRLPVDEQDARQAVRATVAGHLQLLPAVAGVPRALLRLVRECLRLDREQRPPSAQAVLERLAAVVEGRPRWLPSASLFAATAALVVAVPTFSSPTAPFLSLDSGALKLGPALAADAPVTYLRSAALEQVRAHFGGFPAGRLQVEVTKGGTKQLQKLLTPAVQEDSTLVLSVAQRTWGEVVEGIVRASADAPVDISFVVPGLAVLGKARIRVDDQPPVLQQLRVVGRNGPSDRLDSSSVVPLDCRDDCGLADLRLTLRLTDGRVLVFPQDVAATQFDLGSVMAARDVGVLPLGGASLDLVGSDHAGNHSAVTPFVIAGCDFGVPAVVEVTGPASAMVPWLDDRARVHVRLSAAEPGLQIHVRDANDSERAVGAPTLVSGSSYEVVLAASSTGEPFANGYYRFVVEDPAGNRSESPVRLSFLSRRTDAVFGSAGDAPAATVGDEIVVGPDGAVLSLRCSPSFRATSVRVLATGTTPAAPPNAVGIAAAAGQWSITVAALRRGNYELRVGLEAVGDAGAAATELVRRLTVLPAHIAVRLPDAAAHYLPALQSDNLFAGDAAATLDPLEDGVLQQGGAVIVEPELRRHLRGRLWVGNEPAALAPKQSLPDGSAGDPRLLPPTPLLRGRNVLALELSDVLARTVDVVQGDRPARVVRCQGHDLWLLADFVHDPTTPQLVGDPLRVEHGQTVLARLRCNVPFTAAERGELVLAVHRSKEVEATSVRPFGSGCEVAFALRPEVWTTATDLGDLPRSRYAEGVTANMDATLHTPAGNYSLKMLVCTARTTLRNLRLEEVGDRSMRPALAALHMVPVLAPERRAVLVGGIESSVLADPVPATAPGRALYRPQPEEEVRSMADVFVQDREFTLGQYAALLEELPKLGPPRPGLWHDDDPLGSERISVAALVPTAWRDDPRWRDDPKAFLAAAAAQPDAALTGVDFFQAYAAVRLLGLVTAGDASLFRLPLGCELELAAFGPDAPGDTRSGAALQGRVRAAPWQQPAPAGPAGPTAAANAAAGDVVRSPLDTPIHGLDFSLREWVLDLPQGQDTDFGGELVLREWVTDREQHVNYALQLAGARPAPRDTRSRLTAEVQARVRNFGVVRGLPYGQQNGLLDADGAPLRVDGLDVLPPSVPGVVRTEQLRRDGRDLTPGKVDPRLQRTGFRVAGGVVFVERVRGR